MKFCATQSCKNLRERSGTRCGPCRNSIFRYGITVPQREKILSEQMGRCAICDYQIAFDGTSKQYSACIDHDHKTGAVRGILCGNCNTWIGFIENRKIDLDLVKKYISP